MILQVILEGIGLGAILMLVCAFGIRKGAVGMVHLYHDDVQRRCIQLGLTTREEIQRNAIRMKICCLRSISPMCWSVFTPSTARGDSWRASGSCWSSCP